MIRMIPRHFGQAPLNSEGLFPPPNKHFLLNHGQGTLSGRYYSTGQVRGSTFPDQVEDRLRSSGSAGPSFSGIPSNFYRLPGCRGPRPLCFLSVFPGRSRETRDYSTHNTPAIGGTPPCPGCGNIPPEAGPATPEPAPYLIRGHRRPFRRFRLSPGNRILTKP